MGFEPGEIVGRYRLIQQIGEGGFGEVWLAEHREIDRFVAIKFVGRALDRATQVRFQREMEALGRVQHPHVLELFGNGTTELGVGYIVSEYVQGQGLREWAAGRSIHDILDVIRQVASALEAVHREGVVHRDLKPDNIVVVLDRQGGARVKVLDFGLARMLGPDIEDVTATGRVIGTPGFMSPEQLRGQRDVVGPPTDMYCVGVILWELLEERRLFVADGTIGVAMKHLREPPPPLQRDVPDEVAELAIQLLEKDPDARPTARAVVHTLSALDSDARSAERTTPPQTPPEPLNRSRRFWALPLFAGVLTLVVLAMLLLMERDVDQSRPATQVPVSALLEVSDAPGRAPQRTAATDAGDVRDAAIGVDFAGRLPTPGCGRTTGWKPGERQRIAHDGREILVYVPSSYEADVPLPLVVLIHGGSQEPYEMLDEASMESLADEHRFILMAPEGDRLSPFKGGGMAKFAWRTDGVAFQQLPARIGGVMTALCVDAGRLFVVGHGRGGYAALQLLTISDRFAAVATTSHRRVRGGPYPVPRVRVPYLFITPTNSPELPDDGSTNDCQPDRHVPFTEQDRTVREHYGCHGEERPWATSDGATCVTWRCDVPYIRCRVDGGRYWYDYPSDSRRCDGPVSTYDYAGEIWRFFDQVARNRRHDP